MFEFKETTTDKDGNFSFDKKFRKVKIKVKYKTFYSRIRVISKSHVYRMATCSKKKIGKYKGDDVEGIVYNFNYNADETTLEAENW